MPQDIVMPQMGESITEGTVVRWLKKPGDRVKRDEPLFEISTDKVDTEIPSPADGVLAEIRVKEGETVPVNTVVGVLAAPGEESGVKAAPPPRPAERPAPPAERTAPPAERTAPPAERTAPPAEKQAPPAPARTPPAPGQAARAAPAPARPPAQAPPRSTPPPARAPAAPPPAPPAEEEGEGSGPLRTSPLVRKIAQEHGVDIGRVPGTGTGGRVTKKDILDFIASGEGGGAAVAAEEAPPDAGGAWDDSGLRIEPMSIMRAKIAEHMVASRRTSAHVTTFHEVDLTEVARAREARKAAFKSETGFNLTFLPFILKATVDALKEYPVLNASIVEKEVHYHRDVHLGIAVALDDGLIVPIIRNAEERSILGLAKSISDLAERARTKRLTPEEVQGGTFTVTNFGSFGSVFATPIINQPQVAILGVGRAVKRPVVLPDTDAIAVRTMVILSLSFDHRLVDGATADRYVSRVREMLERGPFPLS